MSLNATARRAGDGLRHEIDIDGRHTIVTDEPEELGGIDAGPTPHELLPAALAGCIATMISMYADTEGLGHRRADRRRPVRQQGRASTLRD